MLVMVGLQNDGNNDDTRITIQGNAKVDAVGVGLQANKGWIYSHSRWGGCKDTSFNDI